MTRFASNPWLVAVVVSLATFMEVLDTTITNVSLTHIAGSLGAGQDESTWVLTSYLVANGIVLPLSGWLSDVMGRKKFFITCILGFTAASFMCGAAQSLGMLVICRIIQGAAGGGLQPTQQAIILDSFPPEKRGTVFAITGITMIFAPIIGPTLGGLITDHFDWRWIFYINVPVGLAAAFLCGQILQDPPDAKARGFKNIDFIGLGLVSLGLAALQVVLDKGQQDDWFHSPFIVTWALVCLACLGSAIIWLIGRKEPVVDLGLLSDRTFACCCCLIFIMGFSLYGSSALLPLLLQTNFGYNATLAGMILSPGGFSVIFLMPLIGKLVARVPAKYLVMTGFALCSFGMFHTAGFTPQTDFNTFMFMRITQVLGLPFLFIPISATAFSNIPRDKSNRASALYALFRNMGGSIGIAIAQTTLAMREQVHQTHLADTLIPGRAGYESLVESATRQTGSLEAAKPLMYSMMQKQAWMLSYIDTFTFMGFMLALAMLVAFLLLPSNKPGAKAAQAAAEAH